MAQFDVYKNTNPETRGVYPYLLEVQAEILNNLPTRVVVPLLKKSAVAKTIPVLNPVFNILNTEVFMSTPQLVGVHNTLLGEKICSIKDQRDTIIVALDLLFTGY